MPQQAAERKKKELFVSVEEVKEPEAEFRFGDSKTIFSGIHRLHFLSEASWKIVIFVFLLFCVYFIFIFLLLFCFVFFSVF